MPDDKDKAVLAARVLSYLKRTFSDGPKPTTQETKAAVTAVQLLSTAFPATANDPEKLFEKLIQVSRANGDQRVESELSLMKLQIYMQRQSEMYEMLSNILKMHHDSTKNVINNIR
jgi:hypothetical protein